MNSQFSHQSHHVHQVNICNQCKRPNMTICSNVQKSWTCKLVMTRHVTNAPRTSFLLTTSLRSRNGWWWIKVKIWSQMSDGTRLGCSTLTMQKANKHHTENHRTCVSQKHVQRTSTSTILPEWWWQILKHPWVWFFFGFQADGRCWQGLKVVFRILQDFHELQTFKHDPILSIPV